MQRSQSHSMFFLLKGGRIRSIDQSKSIPQRYQERLRELGIADPDYKVEPRTGEKIATNVIGNFASPRKRQSKIPQKKGKSIHNFVKRKKTKK